MKVLLSVGILLLLPTSVFAAGFAKQSLFLSQATVNEGDTVFIYAVVTNNTVNYFYGKLVFSDEDGPIGTTTVSLDSDRANASSVSWKPKAGSHEVTANLISSDGKVIETENSLFIIDKPASPDSPSSNMPKPTPVTEPDIASTTINSSIPIVQLVAKVSPKVAISTVPTFLKVDSARVAAINTFDKGTEWSKKEMTKRAALPGGFTNTAWLMLATVALYVCTTLAYVVANIGIFYPAIALIFLFILWRMYRLVRR